MQEHYGGAGFKLPAFVLAVAGGATTIAVLVSAMSIYLQLKSYRKPVLQRMVVRIMVMVPLYAVASLISLFSMEAAFAIDAIRDVYEAFVIYCFFVLLLSYLGGERSLLMMLHGRPPKAPPFPVNLFKRELDVSDPYTFLFLKRGILQYVQVKPILAIVTLILKAIGKYNEGDFRANSGYLYVTVIYNFSICLSLYCLAMFWLCVSDDLKAFRPVPKFLCVKGILFFSFWQSVVISILVAADVIKRLGPYTDAEHISTGLNDTLICLEMPFFAFAHMSAFAYTDFIDPHLEYVARMPMLYAFRDAFGSADVVEDSKATLRGEGMDYREFEPSEGVMHQGIGRQRRIQAGLRYSKGGRKKYWLPRPEDDSSGRVNKAIAKIAGTDEDVHAPLLRHDAENVYHIAPDLQHRGRSSNELPDPRVWTEGDDEVEEGYELSFGDLDERDEELFAHSKQYLFGDYNYPVVDVSSEAARVSMWVEEERVLRDERGAWFSPLRGAKGQAALGQRAAPVWQGYGAVGTTDAIASTSSPPKRLDKDSVHTPNGVEEGKVIDYDHNGIDDSSIEPSEVKLRWTKTNRPSPMPPSHSRSPHPSGSQQLPTVNVTSPPVSFSASGNTRHDSGNKLSLSSSVVQSQKNSPGQKSRVLPPDAVDLVIEDRDALRQRQSFERRKGEPAVRGGGLKKVYKKGIAGSQAQQGEVEVDFDGETGHGQGNRVETGERVLRAIGAQPPYGNEEDKDNDAKISGQSWDVQTGEDVIARVVTPPLHARPEDRYDMSNDDNPWAQ